MPGTFSLVMADRFQVFVVILDVVGFLLTVSGFLFCRVIEPARMC